MSTPTLYQILHVQPDAPHEIIHMSYLTLMRRLRMHPDLGGDPDVAARINEAFATLSDPAARARYDRALADSATAPTAPARPAALPPGRDGGRPVTPPLLAACEFCGTLHAARELERQDASCALCASPLYPAALHGQNDSARRAFHRVNREWPLAFQVTYPFGAPLTGITRDLSISGLRFTTATPLDVGQRIRLSCAFCDAIGEVRHAERSGSPPSGTWSVGVAFLTLRVNLAPGGILSKRL